MELFDAMPDWLVWCALAAAGVLALQAVARTIEAALDLDTR